MSSLMSVLCPVWHTFYTRFIIPSVNSLGSTVRATRHPTNCCFGRWLYYSDWLEFLADLVMSYSQTCTWGQLLCSFCGVRGDTCSTCAPFLSSWSWTTHHTWLACVSQVNSISQWSFTKRASSRGRCSTICKKRCVFCFCFKIRFEVSTVSFNFSFFVFVPWSTQKSSFWGRSSNRIGSTENLKQKLLSSSFHDLTASFYLFIYVFPHLSTLTECVPTYYCLKALSSLLGCLGVQRARGFFMLKQARSKMKTMKMCCAHKEWSEAVLVFF